MCAPSVQPGTSRPRTPPRAPPTPRRPRPRRLPLRLLAHAERPTIAWQGAAVILAMGLLTGGRARAQVATSGQSPAPGDSSTARQCRRVESRTNLADLSGRPISAVNVAIGGPRGSRLPLLSRLTSRTHVRTQQNTLRRFLRVAPRDTVDTLRVAESLRRLRRLRYLDDVVLVATDCGAGTPVALTVAARDAMSFRPDVRFNSGTAPNAATGTATASPRSYSVGFEERNFLGAGRELRVAAIGTGGRNGYSLSAGDPTIGGTLYALRGRLARNPIENATAFSIRPPDRELAASWRGELSIADVRRAGVAARGASFERRGGQGLLGHRTQPDDGVGAATFLMIGAESDRARLTAAPGAIIGGPAVVARNFTGLDLGVSRVAESYDEIDWLLPDARVVDAPQGIESDVVVGLGREQTSRHAAAHLDLWTGQLWVDGARRLFAVDLWGSGYVRQGAAVSGGSVRTALTGVLRQRRGYWYARLAFEHLLDPDPDQQALLGFDPTVRMLPTRTRLAQNAVALLAERDWRVNSPVGHMPFDLAAFGAGSYRASPRAPSRAPSGALGSGPGGGPVADVNELSTAVGVGVHLVPNSLGRTALRLDYVIPVSHGEGGHSTPYLAASVAPWILFDRYRDGRRGR